MEIHKSHDNHIKFPTVTGVTKLFAELDKIFLKDSTQSLFQAIESFEQYTRSSSETIDEYIREFEQRYKRLKDLRGNKEAYEDGIKAFKLLHQANLKPEQKRLVRATTIELTYKGMANALKRTFGDGSGILNASLVADAEVPKRSVLWKPSSSTSEDEMNVLYVNGEWYERVDRQRPEENFKDRRYQRPNFYQRQRLEKTQEERRRKRPQFQQRSPKLARRRLGLKSHSRSSPVTGGLVLGACLQVTRAACESYRTSGIHEYSRCPADSANRGG